MTLPGTAGFVLAAGLYGMLAGWALLRLRAGAVQALFAAGLAATALWALAGAAEGPLALVTKLAGNGRTFAWLGFLLTLLLAGRSERAVRASLVLIHATLAAVLAAQTAFDLLPLTLHLGPRAAAMCALVGLLLRMVTAAGALVLVHNLYTAAAHATRPAIRLPLAALAMLWLYDLNCYATAWLLDRWPQTLFEGRGLIAAAAAPLFAIALWRRAGFAMRLSRAAAFRSLSLLGILCYLALLLVIARVTQLLGGDGGWLGLGVTGAGALILGGLMVPRRLRAWTRVTLLKHLFQHRYDYRAEWLRFTDTLGTSGDGAALDLRAVKALADIVEAPAGLLLVPRPDGILAPGPRWNWPLAEVPVQAGGAALIAHLEATARILDLDAARTGRGGDEAALIPAWALALTDAWIAVPLLHFGRLTGIALLARPAIGRALDWEDIDLLRAAGRQVASYLAEARGQEALAQAARFDEFNRRFAFIIHDIKNLVSQLSLVSRNAARHADNPAFRADMIATLQDSVGRMNDLLARLGTQATPVRAEPPQPLPLLPLVETVARTRRAHHPVDVIGAADLAALADPARLAQALGHLLQNAIEASAGGSPVMLRVARSGADAAIEVIDAGTGMSPEFLRTQLFAPFASTKPGGFGIGAHEAQTLVGAMGGRIEVESAVGVGTRFRILLPAADHAAAPLLLDRVA